MPKWLSIHKFLQVKLHLLGFYILWLIGLILLFCYYGIYNYESVSREEIESVLFMEVNPNLILNRSKPDCKYHILRSISTIDPVNVPRKYSDFSASGIVNGSFSPVDCNPLFSVALLVTYRNRQSQLDIFIPYIHDFLRKQNIHYKIYIIEQQDEGPWNKGVLYNIGARTALADGFPCLVLHDVDLLPLDEANLYACAHQPRHMSASIDKFRYVLPYWYLVGGACAMRSEHFVHIDGFSNRYTGWGGEDDDLSIRIQRHGLRILRFPREMSRYTMLVHRQATRNGQRGRLLSEAATYNSDGMRTVAKHVRTTHITRHRLFTLLGVHIY